MHHHVVTFFTQPVFSIKMSSYALKANFLLKTLSLILVSSLQLHLAIRSTQMLTTFY